jgi:hypothetical protein
MQEELELMNNMMITMREQIRRTRFLENLAIMRQQARYAEQLLGGGADEVRFDERWDDMATKRGGKRCSKG